MPNVINIIISYDFLWIFNKFQSKSLKLVKSISHVICSILNIYLLYIPPPPPTNFFRARINITDASIFFKVPMQIIKTVPIPIFVTKNTKNNTMYTVQDPHTFLYLF